MVVLPVTYLPGHKTYIHSQILGVRSFHSASNKWPGVFRAVVAVVCAISRAEVFLAPSSSFTRIQHLFPQLMFFSQPMIWTCKTILLRDCSRSRHNYAFMWRDSRRIPISSITFYCLFYLLCVSQLFAPQLASSFKLFPFQLCIKHPNLTLYQLLHKTPLLLTTQHWTGHESKLLFYCLHHLPLFLLLINRVPPIPSTEAIMDPNKLAMQNAVSMESLDSRSLDNASTISSLEPHSQVGFFVLKRSYFLNLGPHTVCFRVAYGL